MKRQCQGHAWIFVVLNISSRFTYLLSVPDQAALYSGRQRRNQLCCCFGSDSLKVGPLLQDPRLLTACPFFSPSSVGVAMMMSSNGEYGLLAFLAYIDAKIDRQIDG